AIAAAIAAAIAIATPALGERGLQPTLLGGRSVVTALDQVGPRERDEALDLFLTGDCSEVVLWSRWNTERTDGGPDRILARDTGWPRTGNCRVRT
ncbi:MAG: hypothetical protein RBU30_20985, partial [Polyangia bacterium]|nr:hypothetical protein [Polyangia bacterium]